MSPWGMVVSTSTVTLRQILQLLARPMDNVHRLPLVFLTAVGDAQRSGWGDTGAPASRTCVVFVYTYCQLMVKNSWHVWSLATLVNSSSHMTTFILLFLCFCQQRSTCFIHNIFCAYIPLYCIIIHVLTFKCASKDPYVFFMGIVLLRYQRKL